MKRIALSALLAAAALVANAEAYIDKARVVSVEPRYESVNVPRQECSSRWINEPRRNGGHGHSQGRDYGGGIVGGVAGALLGNQVGKGHGREAATALGAVVGAFAGDNIANRGRWDVRDDRDDQPREIKECRTVNEVQSRVTGYQVGYEYRGQRFSTLMRENPGPFVQVRVSVEPVGQVGR